MSIIPTLTRIKPNKCSCYKQKITIIRLEKIIDFWRILLKISKQCKKFNMFVKGKMHYLPLIQNVIKKAQIRFWKKTLKLQFKKKIKS